MPEFSSVEWAALAATLFVAFMAKLTKAEVRTILLAVLVATLTNNPYAVMVVGLFAVLLKLIDFVHVGG